MSAEFREPKTSTIERRPFDGGIEVRVIEDQILIACTTHGERSSIICTEYNARRILGALSVMLGIPASAGCREGDQAVILEGYILVMLGGQILVGKRVERDSGPQPVRDASGIIGHTLKGRPIPALEPVYELHMSAKVDAQGRATGIVRHLVPPLMADVPYINLPDSYAWLPVSALSGPLQREIERGVAMAEETRQKIRMAELGLVPAGGGE